MNEQPIQPNQSSPALAQVESRPGPSADPDMHDGAAMDVLLPSPALFRRFRHGFVSPAMVQVPLLFWVMDVARPRTVVQIGLDDGCAYLALCQAAERLDGGTVCLALPVGQHTLPEDRRSQHDLAYGDFSTILHPDGVEYKLPDGLQIDLLVVGAAVDDAARRDLEQGLLPRMSESGILIILNSDDGTDALTQPCHAQRVFALAGVDEQPLIIGLIGNRQPDRVVTLVAQQPGQPEWLATRQMLNLLGQAMLDRARLRDSVGVDTWLKADLSKTIAERDNQKGMIDKLRKAEAVALERQAELSAALHDMGTTLSQAESDRTRLAKELSQLEPLLGETKLAAEKARAEHRERIEDIAILTGHFTAELDKLRKTVSGNAAEHAATAAKLAQVTAHRDQILTSTSWRITRPLRAVVQRLRGY